MKKERAIQLNNDKFPNDFNADLESNFLLKKQRVLSISNEIQSRNEPEDAKIFRWVISERNKVEKLLKVEFQDVLKEYQEKLNGSFQQVLNEFVKKTFPISPQSDLLNEVFCGKGIHPEDDLKLWFKIKFNKFFDIIEDVEGRSDLNGQLVYIDFVLRLRPEFGKVLEEKLPHFKNAGCFGVEVKYFDLSKGCGSNISEAYAQCIDYSFAKFEVYGKKQHLPCLFLLSNLSFDKEIERLQNSLNLRYRALTVFQEATRLANKFKVGTVKFITEENSMKLLSWSFHIYDQKYLSYQRGYSGGKYDQSKNLSLIRKIGNRQS